MIDNGRWVVGKDEHHCCPCKQLTVIVEPTIVGNELRLLEEEQ